MIAKRMLVSTLMCMALIVIGGGCGTEGVVVPTETNVTAAGSPFIESGNPNPKIIPPNANPHGRSYGEWSNAWWQWLWSAPVAVNPGLDETGENISYGQSGPVWFLAPNYGGVSVRSATIPAGKSLFIDVVGYFTATQIGDGTTEAELRAAAAAATDAVTSISLEIDGVFVEGIEAYRVQSPEMFSYTLPEDNMFTLFGFPTAAGTYYPAVSDGYFVMLAPLSRGAHTIHIIADLSYVVSDVTINLFVGPVPKAM